MTELLTAAQMKAIEAAAIASGEVTGLELMERAGRGVVEAVFEEWPALAKTSHRAVVLCGPGGNGGDGFVVARLLREWGWEVEVFLYGTPEGMPPDARVNYERWLGMGEVGAPSQFQDIDAVVYVDALFGIGLSRPLEREAFEISKSFEDLARSHVGRLMAVDVPSGLCADSGRDMAHGRGGGIRADLTVSFDYAKLGHVSQDGPEHCGKLVVKPIGLDRKRAMRTLGERYDPVTRTKPNGTVVTRLDGIDLRPGFSAKKSILDKGWVTDGDHKYSHGHALILSGPPGKGGAARLAARGALRIGAGLVTVACPHEALPENAARLDAVMLVPVLNAKELAAVLADARINAVAIGPGLSLKRAQMLVPAVLKAKRATVLDADALTAFADDPAKLFAMLHLGCILTPHAGEFARLFPDIAAKLAAPATKGPAYSKVDATREAAARAGCVVLFKGPDTVIADLSGRCSINSAHYDRAAPWLATAGSGDVLTGFITGLLARGFAPMQAAETAAWLHVECARSFGPGLIAEDLPEELPKVLRALGL
jgi:ADP-dependent NAD(P)H-hydrate dehydratase / NAD(P)H-hydrate epimerase